MQHKQEIPILIAEIKDELSKLDMLVDKISSQKGRTDNVEVVESAALRLHNFYTGCERIFSLIASEVNGGAPHEGDWHKRLLNQIALGIDDIRPAVISKQTKTDLEELLRFRHIVRNIYGFELSADRVAHLIDHTIGFYPRLAQELNTFIDFLATLFKEI